MRIRTLLVIITCAISAPAIAQTPRPGVGPNAGSPTFDAPRPIAAHSSVWLEELTWMEVRDVMKAGTTTIIIPTGGVEQNGPYLAAGKHNYVMQATCPAIAKKLGNALCAPIVKFVPEGDFEPPTGHMEYPSTISLRESTFEAMLTDIASSFKAHGFAHIILIGDSGGNQQGMKAVAEALSAKWRDGKTTIHFIPEYYDYDEAAKWADQTFGWKEVDEGLHDDPIISTIMMTVDPETVRIKERAAAGKASINSVPLTPVEQAVKQGQGIVEHRADVTVTAIRKALSSSSRDR